MHYYYIIIFGLECIQTNTIATHFVPPCGYYILKNAFKFSTNQQILTFPGANMSVSLAYIILGSSMLIEGL